MVGSCRIAGTIGTRAPLFDSDGLVARFPNPIHDEYIRLPNWKSSLSFSDEPFHEKSPSKSLGLGDTIRAFETGSILPFGHHLSLPAST